MEGDAQWITPRWKRGMLTGTVPDPAVIVVQDSQASQEASSAAMPPPAPALAKRLRTKDPAATILLPERLPWGPASTRERFLYADFNVRRCPF